MLSYNEFKKHIKETIKDHLTEEYRDYAMEFQHIVNSRGSYEALMIKSVVKSDGPSITPALNISEAFKNYQNGMDLEEIVEQLADIRMKATLNTGINPTDVLNYDKVKNIIIPRLINTTRNLDYLENVPHTENEDLSVVYAIKFNDNAQAVVTNDLMEKWNVDCGTLHDVAMKNLETEPYFFNHIMEMLMSGPFAKSLVLDEVDPHDYENIPPFFTLSTKNMTKGAVMAMNPVVMDKISEKLGDVYVLPSSVHEVLIVPKAAISTDVQQLLNMVKSVNESEVAPEEQLSDNVYEYDANEHSLKLAEGVEIDVDEGIDI